MKVSFDMNERIRELALQAGYMEDMFGIGHWDMPECKKFAELIVRECMTITKDYTCNQGLDYSAPVALARHFGFGVEEWNNYLTNCSTKPSTAVMKHRFGVE
jgi:hypothetical protein